MKNEMKVRVLTAVCSPCGDIFKAAWGGGPKVKGLCAPCLEKVTKIIFSEALKRATEDLK